MGHAVGFQHEQTRADRDGHVSIATGNIQYGLEYNFMRYSRNQVDNYDVPYDYTSVMHYSQYVSLFSDFSWCFGHCFSLKHMLPVTQFNLQTHLMC